MNTTEASIMLSIVFFISFFIMTIFYLFLFFQYVKNKIKIKKVNFLLELGYKIVTFDKNGIPLYMTNNAIIDTVENLYKNEKK